MKDQRSIRRDQRSIADERLRTKALHAKVQILEAENERLMARLCEVREGGISRGWR